MPNTVDNKAIETTTRTSEDLKDKGYTAIKRFILNRGYTILDEDYSFVSVGVDFVAQDPDGPVVFIIAEVIDDNATGFPNDIDLNSKRREYENLMMAWLETHIDEIDNCSVRIDTVRLKVINNDRAFIKHHIDAFSATK